MTQITEEDCGMKITQIGFRVFRIQDQITFSSSCNVVTLNLLMWHVFSSLVTQTFGPVGRLP